MVRTTLPGAKPVPCHLGYGRESLCVYKAMGLPRLGPFSKVWGLCRCSSFFRALTPKPL